MVKLDLFEAQLNIVNDTIGKLGILCQYHEGSI